MGAITIPTTPSTALSRGGRRLSDRRGATALERSRVPGVRIRAGGVTILLNTLGLADPPRAVA